MESRIKTLLDKGKIVRTLCVGGLAHPKFVEFAGQVEGVDGVWFDQEHSAIPHHQLEMLLIACRAAGLDAFTRVPPDNYGTIMRPMEAGCAGVMVAQIRTISEVHQVVQWAKYPPRGVRGLFSANAESNYGFVDVAEHVANTNEKRWLAIQIETEEAVQQIDQIANAEGVDLLFVGPGDLACTLGVPGQVLHPRCVDALEKVATACRNAGKPWGTLSRSIEHARQCRSLGCQLFSIYGDFDVVRHGFATLGETFAELSE